MEKKIYFQPQMKAVVVESESLLAGSNGDGSGSMSGGHDGAKMNFDEDWD